jgi:hypothetical protein
MALSEIDNSREDRQDPLDMRKTHRSALPRHPHGERFLTKRPVAQIAPSVNASWEHSRRTLYMSAILAAPIVSSACMVSLGVVSSVIVEKLMKSTIVDFVFQSLY